MRAVAPRMLIVLFVICLSAGLVPAQDFRATILGQVADKTGAAIPEATVVATKNDTSENFTTKSNAEGMYSLPMLMPGTYTVTVEVIGFAKTVHPNITVSVDQKLNLNFALELKAVQQEVTVLERAEVVESATGSGGVLFDPEQTSNLPLNGRQVYMLLELAEGVMFTQTEFGATGFSGTRGWDVNDKYVMNGAPQGLNRFMLNGAPISTEGMWQVSPNVEAISQFKVMTNMYDASIGRTGGGLVNTTLKSGGNQVHGSLFNFMRNSILDANTFQNNMVGDPRGKHITNQFGGTAGGPIRKGKTFYFGSYEGFRERVPFPRISSTVPPYLRPSAADGSVDFNTIPVNVYDPLTTYCNRTDAAGLCNQWYRRQFPNNKIPAARMDPIGVKIVSLFPAANAPGCGLGATRQACPEQNNFFATGNIGKYRYNQEMVRVDHTMNEANRFNATFTHQLGFEDRNNNGFPPPAEIGNIIAQRKNFNIILGWTHMFSPRRLGDLRLSLGRYDQRFPTGERSFGLTAESLGMKMPDIPTIDLKTAPTIQTSNYEDIIGNRITGYANTHFNIGPSISQTSGRHTMRYGGEFSNNQWGSPQVGYARGLFSFTNVMSRRQPTTGSDGRDLASLLLGYPASGYVDWNDTVFESWKYMAVFIQDDWKIRRNLTLNFGLRWDVQTSLKERFDRVNAGFCFTCVSPLDKLVDHQKYPLLPNPLRGGLLFAGKDGLPRAPFNTYYDQVQPRLGLAWAVTPRTIIRGGTGLFYSFGNQKDTNTGYNERTDYIYSLDDGRTPNPYAPLSNPFPDGTMAPTGASAGLMTSLGSRLGFESPTRRIPRTVQYSFGVQRELPWKILLDTKYSGSRTSRLPIGSGYSNPGTQWNTISEQERAAGEANAAFLDTLVTNPFYGMIDPTTNVGRPTTLNAWKLMRPFPQFDGLRDVTDPAGRAWYDSLQVRVEKRAYGDRPGRGLTFVASYTWQKNFDRLHYLNGASDEGKYPNTEPVRQLVSYDRTHNLSLSGVWNLPIGKGGFIGRSASGWKKEVISGWAMDWIFTHRSGTPTPWPDAIFGYGCTTYKVEQPTIGRWFENTISCYKSRPGWNNRTVLDRFPWIRNSWAPQLAVTARKTFSLTERYKLELRAESFNTTNTPIFPSPSTSIGTAPTVSTAGIWAGLGTIKLQQQNFPRNIQVSMKLRF